MTRRALISAQDGAYLAEFLFSKGYQVSGTSRDSQCSKITNLKKLGIKDQISFVSMMLEDFISVLVAFRQSQADEIYYSRPIICWTFA